MRHRVSARAARRSLMAAVFEFLAANTPDQIGECLARNPVLLAEPADAVLREFLDAARKEGRDDIAAKLAERRSLLGRARESADATDPLGREPGGSDGQPGLSAQLRLALDEIGKPGAEEDPRRQVVLLRRILARPDLGPHAELRAALHGMLGASLASLSERTASSDYEEAIAAFEAALTIHTRTAAPDSWLVSTFNLGKVYARRGSGIHAENIETAITCFNEVLDAGGDQPPGSWRAEVQGELAAAYLERVGGNRSDNIEQAIIYGSAVLADLDPAAPALESAKAHLMLGRAYLWRLEGRRADNIEHAIGHLTAATDLFTQQAFARDWAGLQCDLGVAFRERAVGPPAANLVQALAHFQAARDSAARERQPVDYAIAMNGIGTVYARRMDGDREHDLEMAIACCIEARDGFAELGRPAERAAAQQNLGHAYLHRPAGNRADNVELAIGCLEDALTVRAQDADPLGWAETMHALGNACLQRVYGDHGHNIERAIAAFDRARASFAELGATRQEALARQNLGQAHFSRVSTDRATSIEQAISNLRAAQAAFAAQGMVAEQAAALSGLGNACSERAAGRAGEALEQAISYHKQAIGVLGGGAALPAEWASAHNNLGTAYLERHGYLERQGSVRHEDLTDAIACFEESLATGAAARSPLQQAQTRYNLGVALVERSGQGNPGDLRLAIAHFENALEAFTAVGVSAYCRNGARALGDAYARLGEQWPSALRAYETALEAADALYISSLLREAKEAELAVIPSLHLQAGYIAVKAGQLDKAVAILERGRARGTGDALARDHAELSQVGELDGELAAAFTAAAQEVRQLEATESLTVGAISQRAAADTSAWRGVGADDELRRGLEAARLRLAGAIDGIRRMKGHERFLAQPDFDDVAAIVTRAGPVAYVAVTDYGSVTLVVAEPPGDESADGRPGAVAGLAAEPAEPLTSQVLRSMLIRSDDGMVTGGYLPAQLEGAFPAGSFRKELDDLLPVLGECLAGPLAQHLAALRADRVTLVACGLLGLLPLHAATYQRPGETGRRCLLDDFTVSYAPSARVLGAAHTTLAALPGQAVRAPVLAGVGNPAGSSPLPFAQAEVEEISLLFPTARVRYGRQATKAALIESAPGATHVHLACHGYFDAASPRDSALGLAGEGRADPLTLTQIVTERRFAGTRLVTASACETAFTDFTQLPDEVIGLPSGFLQAGTAGVVGTLWKVADVSTALLMTRFYECHLAGDDDKHEPPMSPARALRHAQLWLAQVSVGDLERYYARHEALRRVRDRHASTDSVAQSWRPYAHPWYWAAFVFVGA